VLVDVGTCQWLAIVVGTNAHKIMCGAWRARKTQVAKYCSFVFFRYESFQLSSAKMARPFLGGLPSLRGQCSIRQCESVSRQAMHIKSVQKEGQKFWSPCSHLFPFSTTPPGMRCSGDQGEKEDSLDSIRLAHSTDSLPAWNLEKPVWSSVGWSARRLGSRSRSPRQAPGRQVRPDPMQNAIRR